MEHTVAKGELEVMESVRFLIVGGGIAGVSCADTLAICCPTSRILLLTETNVIKMVTNLVPVARYLHRFDVQEMDSASTSLSSRIKVIIDQLKHINSEERYILTHGQRKIPYEYLCLCTGGRAKLIDEQSPGVIGIRDTDSVRELQKRLSTARKIAVVGNGGIASELVQELRDIQVHWIIKDSSITSTFLDPGAAKFFEAMLQEKAKNSGKEKKEEQTGEKQKGMIKRLRYEDYKPDNDIEFKHGLNSSETKLGSALGPDWHRKYELKGAANDDKSYIFSLPVIYYRNQVKSIVATPTDPPQYTVNLNDGLEIKNCDFVVSATGVRPRIDYTCCPAIEIDPEDGGIPVNEFMETSMSKVYAAGDVCTCKWSSSTDSAKNSHWFQMRLWTQARQMGSMAGRSMAAAFNGEQIYSDFCFELFGHVTQLFGLPAILIGRYNGQNLGRDYEMLIRSTPGSEYIKFIIQNGRLRGALLIGNTELAETCENLILNGIDLTPYGDDILNPDIDIEDYFD